MTDAELLVERYGGDRGVWGEHPDWPRQDWQYEVANEDTNLGYWDWVLAKLDVADHEEHWTQLMAACEAHGDAEGTETQLGDVEQLLSLALGLMGPVERDAFYRHEIVEGLIADNPQEDT
jgi:hypothetical protein